IFVGHKHVPKHRLGPSMVMPGCPVEMGGSSVRPRRFDIEIHLDEIEAVRRRHRREDRKKTGKAKRAGRKEDGAEPCESAKAIHDWYRAFLKDRIQGCYDGYVRSGNRRPRFKDDEIAFYRSVIDEMLTLERPQLSRIVDSVQAAVIVENDRRMKLDPPEMPLAVPGRDYVNKLTKSISPVDFWTRSYGREVAYRDLHTLGEGLELTRVLERIEIDEQTVDLFVLLREAGILDALGPAEVAALGFDVRQARPTISAAVDCLTGCLVAFQISNKPDFNLTRRTIEMIYLDKTEIAKAAGASSTWDFYGHPEAIAMDKGAVYLSKENWDQLARAGITNLSLPAAHPFLKGNIEGWFRTLSGSHMSHLVGRAFKDVVARGENDAEARGIVDLDTFLRWLTCWIVDVYHNTKPKRPGGKSPRRRWDEAVQSVPPQIRTDNRRLRTAFGQTMARKITRVGVNVGGIVYQSEELEAWFAKDQRRDVSVLWWHRNIGEVEVGLPDGRWVSVPSKEGKWAGESYVDYKVWLAEADYEDRKETLTAAKARRAIDLEVLALKKRLSGTLPMVPSAAQLARDEADMRRFSRTRDRVEPEARPLFGDEVAIDEPADSPPSADEEGPFANPDDYSDILE
ncbi:hypothetical protein, partial [Wenxinia saemankumensis]|uniref:hypothetical protein n=1 Tax=Wenxinia saemankumensis TaxID=1447782 RepID=UPI001BB009E8